MTVRELIEQLSYYDQDALVFAESSEEQFEIKAVRNEDYVLTKLVVLSKEKED